jgi:hypothetical protein
MRSEIMKTMFLAAAAALSLGIGSAYADAGGGQAGGYVYPDYIAPGAIYAGAPSPVQNTPPVATAQNGQTIHAYVAHSRSLGTWLFPPDTNGGGNN